MSWMKAARLAVVVLPLIVASADAPAAESLDRALSLAAEERYEEARELLDPFLQRNPGHPRARLLHGILMARAGRVSDAINVFRALLEDHPAMFEPYNNLAVLYAVQGRLDEARETLLAALEHQPAAVVYENLGDVYSDLARRAYSRARSFADRGAASSEEAEAARAAAEPEGEEGVLVLPDPQSVSAGASKEGPARSGVCARVGGFEDLDAVSGAVQWLRSRGAEILAVRLEEDHSVTSYRVFLPPLPSHEKATRTVREIQEKGVRDVAVIGEGALKNGVSFGVYRDEENMRRRVAALEKLGYAARSAPDVDIVDDYVVEVHAPAAFDADWPAHFPDHPILSVECGGVLETR